MPAHNTNASYGSVARLFHWSTALLILTLIPLGFIAEKYPYETAEDMAVKMQLFTVHKTLGIAAFFVALARILWALRQPHPAPLHPERTLETFAANIVHWLLYGAMVLVPLSGWLYHATTVGFAPIFWPFGQDLPFIPKSESLGAIFKAGHVIFVFVLIFSLAAHIAGALKHVIIDRDATLARMTHGKAAAPTSGQGNSQALPVIGALGIWLAAAFAAFTAGQMPANTPPSTTAETQNPVSAEQDSPAEQGNWLVESGNLGIAVTQMGSSVKGNFGEWAAQIRFDETPRPDGSHGTVEVLINVASVTLGSVSDQAKGADFFDIATHPMAIFNAKIMPDGAGYVADGTLTLRGQTVPVTLPFSLAIEGDRATMNGTTQLDRRDYKIGEKYADEKTVGFVTEVTVELTAKKISP